MLKSSLIYVENAGRYLMLHRVIKSNNPNKYKWIGVGGKLEDGETPEECARREMTEETGLTPMDMSYRGVVMFRSDRWPDEEMHLFTCREFSGKLIPCDEGVLEWVAKSEVPRLPIWEGDKIFLKLLAEGAPFFRLNLRYEGEKLAEWELA